MSDFQSFHFSADSVDFFRELKANNSKDWFEANKQRFEASVKSPSHEFADHLSQALCELSDRDVVPKVFRLHRDLRFSKDKTPYKPYQHFLFARSGLGKSGPSWFFALEPDRLVVGAGVFQFEKAGLDAFRSAMNGVEAGKLSTILADLHAKGFTLSEAELKRVPRGYDADHPYADLLRRKSLAVWKDLDVVMASQAGLLPALMADYEQLLPIDRWLERCFL